MGILGGEKCDVFFYGYWDENEYYREDCEKVKGWWVYCFECVII